MAETDHFVNKPKLLDQVRNVIRVKHYSIRTEEAYVQWVRRFVLFHNKQHPQEMGEREIAEFLTFLATVRKVAASTQNQALNAIVFLYREVLRQGDAPEKAERRCGLSVQDVNCACGRRLRMTSGSICKPRMPISAAS